MTLPPLTRSTPFRLTVRLVLIFVAAMLACLVAAFLVIRSYLDADLHRALAQDLTSWSAGEDASDIVERVARAVEITPPRSRLIVLLADGGRRIGNVEGLGPVKGFRVVEDSDLSAPGFELADSYLITSASVPGGTLVLGRDREKVSELGEIFLLTFGLGVVPTLLFAAGLGLFTAVGTSRRVEAIRLALERMTGGDLKARVPGAGSEDDLGEIGSAVNRMAAAQEAAMSSLRQVSADIAHDLKTPIQRVSVLLDVLKAGGPLTEAQEEALARARGETQQIVQTFQSLLQIAQLEGGGARSHFTTVELGEVVCGIVEVYGPAAEESGHRLQFAPAAAPVVIRGDRNLIGQIVANLVENGLRHTPEGSRIGVSLSGEGELIVADDGPGIPEEERQNVLRRLYRLERSRTTEGNGLGLSLVAAIADLHGARLSLEDARPGLRVRLQFPKP